MSPFAAAERGYIDEVIMPHSTRRRVARALRLLRGKELANPWKKHRQYSAVSGRSVRARDRQRLPHASDDATSDACAPHLDIDDDVLQAGKGAGLQREREDGGEDPLRPRSHSANQCKTTCPAHRGPGGAILRNGWYVFPSRGGIVTKEMVDAPSWRRLI